MIYGHGFSALWQSTYACTNFLASVSVGCYSLSSHRAYMCRLSFACVSYKMLWEELMYQMSLWVFIVHKESDARGDWVGSRDMLHQCKTVRIRDSWWYKLVQLTNKFRVWQHSLDLCFMLLKWSKLNVLMWRHRAYDLKHLKNSQTCMCNHSYFSIFNQRSLL